MSNISNSADKDRLFMKSLPYRLDCLTKISNLKDSN